MNHIRPSTTRSKSATRSKSVTRSKRELSGNISLKDLTNDDLKILITQLPLLERLGECNQDVRDQILKHITGLSDTRNQPDLETSVEKQK